ncbi:hypothetical protein BP5796_13149 [Coleophoma crateriformis]|uniref:Uncharacterized protein n=1 Tax=Coleophoma crateriformis TaxID=565419 RepID=A0A3D8Q4F5_9HELO|nr:hypothetical protein BP5796_13149 [Coleophoma crateriformis]
MQLSVALILAMASIAVANPLAGSSDVEAKAQVARAVCNGIGNCYDNGCGGTADHLFCKAVSFSLQL